MCFVAGTAAAQAVLPATPEPAPPPPEDCRRIAAIRIVRVDVFDTTLPEEDNALFRLANALHIDTRESTVRQLLLFKDGDAYDPRVLQESERLLRATGYLRDATVKPLACVEGEAEVEVRVQDVWTLKPGVSYGRKGGRNSSAVGLDDNNLLGLGTRLGLLLKSGVDREQRVLSYRDPLLGGQRLDLWAQYGRNSDGRLSALALERPFYALDTRWAAGIAGRRETRVDPVYDQGQRVGSHQVSERYGRVYGGLSEGLRDGWATRWAVGFTHDEYRAVPYEGSALVSGVTTGRRLAYPWIALDRVQDDYEETRNQDQIGKTEDVALGWHLMGQLGVALPRFGADRRALPFKLLATRGLQPWPGHTLLLGANAMGRLEDGGAAGTQVTGSVRYYLRESVHRTTFATFAVDRVVRPDNDQTLQLGGDSGLRGYPLRYQSGEGRWLATVEQRWFTGWYLWRLFNVGGAVFYDMGRTWGQGSTATGSQGVLRDAGMGLRLGNSRSALANVLHFDIAFPLDGDRSIKKVQFLLEAKRSL
jgi:hypothetical protein